MLGVSSFDLKEEVVNIFDNHAISDADEVIYTLEQYKFVSRDVILDKLLAEYPDVYFQSISSINRDNKFYEIEQEYGVLINKVSSTSVEIIYAFFDEIRFESLSLALGEYDIKFVAVTMFNMMYLLNPQYRPEYDPDILFKRILLEAVDLHATDLHFTVKHRDLKPVYCIEYRRNGILFPMNLFELDADLNKSMIYKLIDRKTDSNSLDIAQSSGVVSSVDDIFNNGKIELRISANKVKGGFRYVIRIQEKTTISFTIDQLGFSPAVQKDIDVLADKRSGITLITGAIKTGKNTTAFAMANKMIKSPISLVSYDSPVEVLMEFSQVDYMEDPERLLNCVRLAKKQDVNVAFLNEIPNKSVAFAVQDLANSSVYVITTMHLDRIWHLPYRLQEYYGADYKNVISQINGVINQKMFGVACPYCQHTILTTEIENRLVSEFLTSAGVKSIKVSRGCEKCTDPVTNAYGSILGKNQPYAEHLLFDDNLKSELLACEQAWQMESVIKREVKQRKQSLEFYMLEGIVNDKLGIDSLNYIL